MLITGFLTVAWLTGSVLAFLPELEDTLNPELRISAGAVGWNPASLLERAE